MERKPFLTERFYQNSFFTVIALNELLEKRLIADKEIYENGDVVFLHVLDNEASRKILSEIFSDIDAYKAYNAEYHDLVGDDYDDLIDLSALDDLQVESWGSAGEIRWDSICQEFCERESLDD